MLALGVMAAEAGAHGLGVGWKVRDGRIRLAAFFDDDTAPRHALVRVRNADNETIAEGKTDAKGEWSFATPKPGEYEVIVDAGGGHRTARKLVVRATGPEERPLDFTEPNHAHNAAEPRVVVEGGDERSAFTQFPWLRLAIGLGAIAAISIAYLAARRLSRNK
jgi:hypothetical protein